MTANRVDLEDNKEFVQDLHKFCKENRTNRNTYAILVRTQEGVLEIHRRVRRPCYGEMRAYKEKSLNRKEDFFPSDLVNNFPDGTPVGVVVPMSTVSNDPKVSQILRWMWGESNPWLGKNKEFTDNVVYFESEQGVLEGVFVNTGDIPPTFLVATMMVQRGLSSNHHRNYEELKKNGVPENEARILCFNIFVGPSYIVLQGGAVFSLQSNLRMVLNQTPQDLDGGLLWSDRADYNRPEIMNAFKVGDEHPLHFINYSPPENFYRKFGYLMEDKLAA